MDTKFHPAIAAIKSGDVEGLKTLVNQDPSLATARSSKSHPTLLQCVVLDAIDLPNKVELTKVLIDAGAEINGPLCAAASIGNVEAAGALLDAGALVNGTGGWSPLEEALYWDNDGVIKLLLYRGASVHNLRLAAGLGRVELIEGFFNSDGSLKPEAGKIDWPFGDPQTSNLAKPIKEELQSKIEAWSNDSREIINNAFVYACMHNRLEAAKLLLQKGADINAIPAGFDYAGTGLHYAALRGHRTMVEFLLEHGANPTVKDPKVNNSPAGWADYGGHKELREYLEQTAQEHRSS
ncbi:MAG: ankyrin repeat domain-containing protein [Pyrinomonadaceae bacterium]|nr:ankyrin repeat domain-containing protein [Pyrinomonadaceae bacterium]